MPNPQEFYYFLTYSFPVNSFPVNSQQSTAFLSTVNSQQPTPNNHERCHQNRDRSSALICVHLPSSAVKKENC
ncbi:hypothetical protein [Tychonema sp. LEGE 07203]|uniref:hypothetical protein n=1 Tax=Tychonema sp. LEGE 07203 TaxID=1828671 RepID=UPI001880DA25|nr:hypothetical protein [Tychonema sp. LEGE 07203]MBE9095845.1 hypothetical protein [Tychonema sp. LEGE 07203]